MYIIHTHFYSNSKTPYSKVCITIYGEELSKQRKATYFLPKNVKSFPYFKKAGKYSTFMTLGRNAAPLARQLIKNNENKMLRLMVTFLHILAKKLTGERKIIKTDDLYKISELD